MTLGLYPDLSIENVSKIAFEVNAQIAVDINPNDEKNKLKQEITLSNLIDIYIERHSKKHKVIWYYDNTDVKSLLLSLQKEKFLQLLMMR